MDQLLYVEYDLRNQAGEELSRVRYTEDWNHKYNYKKSRVRHCKLYQVYEQRPLHYLSYNNEGIIEKQRLIDIFNTVGIWNLREIIRHTEDLGSQTTRQHSARISVDIEKHACELICLLKNTL